MDPSSAPIGGVVGGVAPLHDDSARRSIERDARSSDATGPATAAEDGVAGERARAPRGGAAPVYSTLSADGRTVESFDGPGVPYAHKFTSVRSATGEAPRGIATLGGVVATDLICWDHYFQRACVARRDGDDPKVPGSIPTAATPCGLCHDLGDVTTVCSGRIREALGQVKVGKAVRRGRSACRWGAGCTKAHPTDENVRATLFEWYKANVTHAKTPEWSVTGAGAARFRAKDDDGRAAATSRRLGPSGETIGNPSEETLSKETLSEETLSEETPERRERAIERIRTRFLRKSAESPYLSRFTREPFFEVVLADPRTRRLFSHKKAPKEVTEAYGTYERVRELLSRLDPTIGAKSATPETVVTPGNVVIFDACSGRGVTAALLSFWFPDAEIVMMDSNGAMDLSHVRALPNRNVVFRHVDLYGASVVEVIRKETARDGGDDDGEFGKGRSGRKRTAVLVGTHLCGALSPRLIDLCFGLDEVDGMILCPCCIKGQLGGDCMRAAKTRGVSAYVVLCETLARLCEREVGLPSGTKEVVGAVGFDPGTVGSVSVRADPGVCSPVNCFITVAKGAGGACGAC